MDLKKIITNQIVIKYTEILIMYKGYQNLNQETLKLQFLMMKAAKLLMI